MPKVFEQDGFPFSFFSNDHLPIHVHVRYGGGDAIFAVEDNVRLRESCGLGVQDLRKAQRLAEENKILIIRRWHENFDA
jgi:hypothetical protein